MLGAGRGDLPVCTRLDEPWTHVVGIDFRFFAGQDPAAVGEGYLRGRVVYAGLPVVGKEPCVFVDDSVGELLGESRTVDVEHPVGRDHLVPARQDEGREVGIVIEVVVGEKDVIDLGGRNTGSGKFPGGGWPAVEQQLLVADLHHVGRTKAVGEWRWRAAPDDSDFKCK